MGVGSCYAELPPNEARQLTGVLDIYVIHKRKSSTPFWAYSEVPGLDQFTACGNSEQEAVNSLLAKVLASMESNDVVSVSRRSYAYPLKYTPMFLVEASKE